VNNFWLTYYDDIPRFLASAYLLLLIPSFSREEQEEEEEEEEENKGVHDIPHILVLRIEEKVNRSLAGVMDGH
jgi:hypothetical protein